MSSPYQAVIFLCHGLGGSAQAEKSVAEHLQKQLPYAIKFICPQAPTIQVDYYADWHRGPLVEPAWYNIVSREEIENGEKDHGLIHTIGEIDKLIEKETAEGVPSQNIFIEGFSQGGSLTLSLALAAKYKLGGLVALGTFLPYQKVLKRLETGKNKTTPIFMGHGEEDKIEFAVPYEMGQKSAQVLVGNGYQVQFKNYPGVGHNPVPMYVDMVEFLKKQLASKGLRQYSLETSSPANVEIVEITKPAAIINSQKEKVLLNLDKICLDPMGDFCSAESLKNRSFRDATDYYYSGKHGERYAYQVNYFLVIIKRIFNHPWILLLLVY